MKRDVRNRLFCMAIVVVFLTWFAVVGCNGSIESSPNPVSNCEHCEKADARADALVDLLAQERLRVEQQRAQLNETIIKAVNAQGERLKALEQPKVIEPAKD